jgi:predicted transcriptional regulator
MQIEEQTTSVGLAENKIELEQIVRNLEQKCRNCRIISPIICVSDCKTWKMKNQIRNLHEKIHGTDFLDRLFNSLKNNRRLRILNLVARQRSSLIQLQTELKSRGYGHSRQTIVDEYIVPMIHVGLFQEGQNPYATTLLGSCVNSVIKDFQEFEKLLPAHSECNEEKVLMALIQEPKTLEGIRSAVPNKNAPRVLSRLQKTGLVQTPREKDYVFFFKTRRDPHLSNQSDTECKVYDNIPENGISAKRLACETNISLRRTYKYIRRLKGKKLIFTRRKPLTYSLTDKGSKLAAVLKSLKDISVETQEMTSIFLQNEKEDAAKIPTQISARNSNVCTLTESSSDLSMFLKKTRKLVSVQKAFENEKHGEWRLRTALV